MKVYVILAAGGSGARMHTSVNKVLLSLSGCTVLLRSLRIFDHIIDGLVLVCRPEDEEAIQAEVALGALSFPVTIVHGGATRQQSVWNGLKSLRADPEDIVLVHDAARCLASPDLVRTLIRTCMETGACVPGVPAVNTVKECDPAGRIVRTPDRSALFEVQTPQAFRYQDLCDANLRAGEDGFQATDDASLLEHAGYPVFVVPGSRMNIKITEKEDLMIASAWLRSNAPAAPRVGMGYDVHRLVEGRKLILCGIEIPHVFGLLGHSDADVAIHALMDAMLGAAALGDIGHCFPDTDPQYKGISSVILLEKVNDMIRSAGYTLINVDLTIAAQKPRLAPYIGQMREKIAETLAVDVSCISIKATTTEKLGFEGREEGISAQAVCLLL